jgi:hypothetical protein
MNPQHPKVCFCNAAICLQSSQRCCQPSQPLNSQAPGAMFNQTAATKACRRLLQAATSNAIVHMPAGMPSLNSPSGGAALWSATALLPAKYSSQLFQLWARTAFDKTAKTHALTRTKEQLAQRMLAGTARLAAMHTHTYAGMQSLNSPSGGAALWSAAAARPCLLT